MRIVFLFTVLLTACTAWGQDCEDPCLPMAVPEGEPTAGPDYEDTLNGGCYSAAQAFQTIDWVHHADPSHPYHGRAWLCGRLSWDLSLPAGSRWADTDWYVATPAESGYMEITLASQEGCWLYRIQPPDCGATIQVVNSRYSSCGSPTFLTFPVVAGVPVYFVIHPPSTSDHVPEFSYFLTVSNLEGEVLPVETLSWGALKSTYR